MNNKQDIILIGSRFPVIFLFRVYDICQPVLRSEKFHFRIQKRCYKRWPGVLLLKKKNNPQLAKDEFRRSLLIDLAVFVGIFI